MVVPYRHTCDLASLESEASLECMEFIQLCIKILNRFASPDGFNLGMNMGRAAGAGVGEHIHWHVVPRWNGDTSFIALTAETRIVPQYLEKTYADLQSLFSES
jgi:ATP adenylyltransferase